MNTQPRGIVMFAVLLIVVIGALSAATVLLASGAVADGQVAQGNRVRARAVAWSGVQAVVSSLGAQRDEMIQGRAPSLDEEIELWTTDDGQRAVARVLVGPVAEAAKIDLNRATPETLAAIPGLGQEAAEAIVSARTIRGFGSVHEAVRAALASAPESDTASTAGALPGWAEHVTVFSAEPRVQAGLGEYGEGNEGFARIQIEGEWSEALGAGLDERFGRGVGEIVKELLGREFRFDSPNAIVRSLRGTGVWPRMWPGALDGLASGPGPYASGRVDINRASSEVLACLPGLDATLAQEIVSARDGLSDAELATVVWPVLTDIMTETEFEETCDALTNRCFQWRVVVETGYVSDGDGYLPADEFGFAESSPGPLRSRRVLEFVVDTADLAPRVAMMRDVTWRGRAVRDGDGLDEDAFGAGVSTGPGSAFEDDLLESDDGSEWGSDGGGGGLGDLPSLDDALSLDDLGAEATVEGPPADAPASQGLQPGDGRVGRWRALGSEGGS